MTNLVLIQQLSSLVYLVTMTVVGTRLMLLYRRTRELPELLLGASVVIGAALGGPLEGMGVSMRADLEPQVAGSMFLFGKFFLTIAIACQLTFTRIVFRPHGPQGKLAVGVLLSILTLCMVGFGASGSYSAAEISVTWFFLEFAARVAGSLWLTTESFRYFGMMKRRMRLGMADPVVTNRFLLWGMAGCFVMAVQLTSVPPLFLDPIKDQVALVFDLVVFSTCGITVSVLYWMTFFPPAAYQRMLRARAEEAA